MFVGDVNQVSGKARREQSTKEVDAQANPPTKKREVRVVGPS
jgi:hypothetical protein